MAGQFAVLKPDWIEPALYDTFIRRKAHENLTSTKPLRDAAKKAVDSCTPDDWNSTIAGSRAKGTDIDGDLDLIVRNLKAVTTEEHKKYINAIHESFKERVESLELGFDYEIKYFQRKRAAMFALINTANNRTLFSFDLIWEKSMFELYIAFDYFSGKEYLQNAVRGVKMYFRQDGLPRMKGIMSEMLVLYAHSLEPELRIASKIFLKVIIVLGNLVGADAYAAFKDKVNAELRRLNVPEKLTYEEQYLQCYADYARRLINWLNKNKEPIKNINDISLLFLKGA